MGQGKRVIAVCCLGLLASGCLPVLNPGYISMTPRATGKVDLQIQGGSGYPFLGWGAIHVEPYATPRLSVPIGFIWAYPGAGAARVGFRYRLGRVVSLGGGAGAAFSYIPEEDPSVYGAVLLDLELGLGHRWNWFGLSFTFRPTYQVPNAMVFPAGLAFAFYVSEHWAINLLLHGGCAVYFGSEGNFFSSERNFSWVGGGGGGIGVLGQL